MGRPGRWPGSGAFLRAGFCGHRLYAGIFLRALTSTLSPAVALLRFHVRIRISSYGYLSDMSPRPGWRYIRYVDLDSYLPILGLRMGWTISPKMWLATVAVQHSRSINCNDDYCGHTWCNCLAQPMTSSLTSNTAIVIAASLAAVFREN